MGVVRATQREDCVKPGQPSLEYASLLATGHSTTVNIDIGI